VRLVVFDYDGTLVDSQAMIVATMQSAFAELGRAAPESVAVRGVIGLALERAILQLAVPPGTAAGEPELALVAALAAAYRRRVVAARARHGVGREPLFLGMRAVVQALDRPDRLLAIATGKNRRGLLHGLAGHDLARHFAILKTADDGPSKPHPAILEQAMAEAGARPEETLMIGDTAFDMQMARQAGAHALGVAWGYHATDELLAAGARQVALRPADLPALVEALACAS